MCTYISKENLCRASKSASVRGLSNFALVLDTVNRIPVNMLYAVTQFTWFWSTLVPTTTLSSSSSSFLFLLLARFCRTASAQRIASSSGSTSSWGMFECIDCVFRRLRLKDPRLIPAARVVGENLPVVKTASSPSREFRVVPTFGTCSVCRCFSCTDPGCCVEGEDGEGTGGAGYEGGEDNRWGEAVAARDGDSTGSRVAGRSDDVYVNGPVLCGCVDMGGGMVVFFESEGSLSPFVDGIVSVVSF
jgi:hypothetical protein